MICGHFNFKVFALSYMRTNDLDFPKICINISNNHQIIVERGDKTDTKNKKFNRNALFSQITFFESVQKMLYFV